MNDIKLRCEKGVIIFFYTMEKLSSGVERETLSVSFLLGLGNYLVVMRRDERPLSNMSRVNYEERSGRKTA